MPDSLTITFASILVTSHGDWVDFGEIYWRLLIDGVSLQGEGQSLAASPTTVSDGAALMPASPDRTVRKYPSQQLIVEGYFAEKDKLVPHRPACFRDTHTKSSNWGIGTHTRSLRDSNLEVTLSYRIERA